jgi:hypothetical protein
MDQEEFFTAIKALVLDAISTGQHEQIIQSSVPGYRSIHREKLFFTATELSLQYGALHDKVVEAYNSNPPTIHLN